MFNEKKNSRHSPFNYNKIGRKEKTQIKLIRIFLLGSVIGPGKKRTKNVMFMKMSITVKSVHQKYQGAIFI
jgi:hypothetical protein